MPGSRPSTRPRKCAARRALPSACRPRRRCSYLDGLVRGVYAKRDLPAGHILTDDDRLSRHSAAKRPDLLPRNDARRGAAATRGERRRRRLHQYRQPVRRGFSARQNDRSARHRPGARRAAARRAAAGLSRLARRRLHRSARCGARHKTCLYGHRRRGDASQRCALPATRICTGICLHHEQACAMAAEAYCRLCGRTGAASMSPPGPAASTRSTACMAPRRIPSACSSISGQVKRETLVSQLRPAAPPARRPGGGYRQHGAGHYEIRDRAARPAGRALSWWKKRCISPSSGRPGPVWIDVPVDVQGAHIDPATLRGFEPEAEAGVPGDALRAAVREVAAALAQAPNGPLSCPARACALPGAHAAFLQLVEALDFPSPPPLTRMTCSPMTIPATSASPARWATAPGISPCRMPIGADPRLPAEHPPDQL